MLVCFHPVERALFFLRFSGEMGQARGESGVQVTRDGRGAEKFFRTPPFARDLHSALASVRAEKRQKLAPASEG